MIIDVTVEELYPFHSISENNGHCDYGQTLEVDTGLFKAWEKAEALAQYLKGCLLTDLKDHE